MVPQPTRALTEFAKHIADPLVDKGWNLHLKFGKGEPQKEEFVPGTIPQKTSTKTVVREKICGPPREKQIPLEMVLVGEAEVKEVVVVGKSLQKIKLNLQNFIRNMMMMMVLVQKFH